MRLKRGRRKTGRSAPIKPPLAVRVPWWVGWGMAALGIVLLSWDSGARLRDLFVARGWNASLGLVSGALASGVILAVLLFLANHTRFAHFRQALSPVPAHLFDIYQRLPVLPKTFFVRNGRVVGDKKRVERENRRSGWGLVVVDGQSAAVFEDQRQGTPFIAGPGVTMIRPEHTLTATIALRPLVVVYGGNPWSAQAPPTAEAVRVHLTGGDVAARLVGVFALLSPEDLTPPAWYAWLHDRARARGQPRPQPTTREAQRHRKEFEARRFRTAFHGHGLTAQAFAEEVLTDVLRWAAEHPDERVRNQVPELFEGSRALFQALLRSAWVEEVSRIHEVTRLFEPVHPHSTLRWIDEVARAVRQRFIQPTFLPSDAALHTSPKPLKSPEYWRLRGMGVKARTANVVQVYLPPKLEQRWIQTAYEPLWRLVQQLRSDAQRYHYLRERDLARVDATMSLAAYMATRSLENGTPYFPLEALQREGPAAIPRLMLALTEGSYHWLIEAGTLDPREARLERLYKISTWLRAVQRWRADEEES